jgi:hypothetical protein
MFLQDSSLVAVACEHHVVITIKASLCVKAHPEVMPDAM